MSSIIAYMHVMWPWPTSVFRHTLEAQSIFYFAVLGFVLECAHRKQVMCDQDGTVCYNV